MAAFFSIFYFKVLFLCFLLFWASSRKPSLRLCCNLVEMFSVERTNQPVHKVALLLIPDFYILCKWLCLLMLGKILSNFAILQQKGKESHDDPVLS